MTNGSYHTGKEKLDYLWQVFGIALELKRPHCNTSVWALHTEKRLHVWKFLKVDMMLYSCSFPWTVTW